MPSAVLVAAAAVLGSLVGEPVTRIAAAVRPAEQRSSTIRAGSAHPGSRSPRRFRGRGAVAAGTAVLFALTAWRFGLSWELPAFLVLASAGMLLAVVDLRHRLLPDRIVLPALAAGTGLLAVAAAVDGSWASLGRAGLGAAALFTVFLVLALISPRSLGMGDVKLAALLGLHLGWLGWPVLLVGAAGGFLLQALASLVLLAIGRVGWKGELPFGPAMLLGAAAAIGAAPILLH